jgi:tRNA-specific 2-thiouridylase
MSINTLPTEKKRIAVAMSGGVDSSVAAYLLAQAGHELVGITAWTLNGPGKCCNDALVNAGRVCEMLNIPYDTVDLRAEFSHFVMNYYNNSYEAGLTPNPCVECNRYVKWEKLVEYAVKEHGVDYVATGHYAKLQHFPATGSVKVFRSRDEHKDQTYMMARVYPKDLIHTVFPLGDMTKPEVVALAREVDLPTAYSKESQDICFVLDGQANYMASVFGSRPGPIVDLDTGKTVGEHEGYFRFTVGQRKGVKVAAGRPIYVVKVDPATNTVYVGDKHHLETTRFRVKAVNWLEAPPAFPFESAVKIRYNSPPTLGTVSLADPASTAAEPDLIVELAAPQMAVTPGQIAAFYDPSFTQLWGGGYIEAHLSHDPFDPAAHTTLPELTACSI